MATNCKVRWLVAGEGVGITLNPEVKILPLPSLGKEEVATFLYSLTARFHFHLADLAIPHFQWTVSPSVSSLPFGQVQAQSSSHETSPSAPIFHLPVASHSPTNVSGKSQKWTIHTLNCTTF
jgi:hypothetical protein